MPKIDAAHFQKLLTGIGTQTLLQNELSGLIEIQNTLPSLVRSLMLGKFTPSTGPTAIDNSGCQFEKFVRSRASQA